MTLLTRAATRVVECLALGYGVSIYANFNNAASKDQGEPANARCRTSNLLDRRRFYALLAQKLYPSTRSSTRGSQHAAVWYRT